MVGVRASGRIRGRERVSFSIVEEEKSQDDFILSNVLMYS